MQVLTSTFDPYIARFRNRFGISAAILKWIAVVSMLVDHTGATLINHLKYSSALSSNQALLHQITVLYKYMRRFGRIAFPLYCFMIVEGYFHTRNVSRYTRRLLLFALLSEFPFDYALHHGQPLLYKQNVYFTLLIGLCVIWVVDSFLKGLPAMQLIVMIVALFFVKDLRTDYNYHGVFLIELLYICHASRFWQSACSGAYLQYYEGMPTPAASVLTLLYNGKRGRQPKYFFYLFYPVHLLVLGFLTYQILPALGI